jgi:CelD/BcsL family acetyltransferase involved in cellulose biosynthesis
MRRQCLAASQIPVVAAAPVSALGHESLSLRVYQNLSELQELEPHWDVLVSEYPFASIFCTWEWLVSWWQSFGKDRTLLVLALCDSDSHLLGLAPLSVSSERWGSIPFRLLRLMGDGSGDSDNLDFPVRPGWESFLASKVVEYLHDHRRLWDIMQLNTMPMESPVARDLIDAIQPRRWLCLQYSRHRLTVLLPPTWEEYLEQISPKERRNFAYYGRRLRKKYAVRFYRCSSESQLADCLEALFRMHQLRWQQAGQSGSFAGGLRREFYYDLSRRLLARNRLELWIAELDGKIAAAQFAMRYGRKVYSLQEGYDPAHSSDRLGFILRGEVLRQLISEGVQVYDFLGGDDPHKMRWRAATGWYRDIHVARSWSRGSVLLCGSQRMSTAKEWLRAHLASSVWGLLHRANVACGAARARSNFASNLGGTSREDSRSSR